MKVLILGSVALPVPPPLQGGTERVAFAQAIGLSKKGHTVTLIAAQGSVPCDQYQLVSIGGGDTVAGSWNSTNPTNLTNPTNEKVIVESSRKLRTEMAYLTDVLGWMDAHADDVDVVINNMRGGEVLFHLSAKRLRKTYVNVMHLPMFAALADLCKRHKTPLVSISNAQRQPFPGLNYVGTVYNGVDVAEYTGERGDTGDRGEYLLMMGSITPHKNQAYGIAVAKTLGMKLVIAGKIGDSAYYAKEIAPSIDGIRVVHIGEIGMQEKVELYKSARALLFPVLWEEPFGLVMIEAMACGTPVVAFHRGAVPEVVADGKTGFIVGDGERGRGGDGMITKTGVEGLVEAVRRIGEIDRAACRTHVEQHFTNEQMIASLDGVLQSL